VSTNNLRQLKQQLIALPEIVSASQLGAHLRLLVNKTILDPTGFLTNSKIIPSHTEMRIVRASLEDVFVLSTGNHINTNPNTIINKVKA
jgi:ABC-2 type transport system ATP-binding protein